MIFDIHSFQIMTLSSLELQVVTQIRPDWVSVSISSKSNLHLFSNIQAKNYTWLKTHCPGKWYEEEEYENWTINRIKHNRLYISITSSYIFTQVYISVLVRNQWALDMGNDIHFPQENWYRLPWLHVWIHWIQKLWVILSDLSNKTTDVSD